MAEQTSALDRIIKAMVVKGWRVTEQRKRLAALFASTDGYLSPKEVYEHMREKYPGVSFDTVYRNLRQLSELGVFEQFYFNDGLKFRASCLSHHHHHLICMKCEKTITFDYCPMPQLADLPGNYEVMHHRFEVYGYCPECVAHKGENVQQESVSD